METIYVFSFKTEMLPGKQCLVRLIVSQKGAKHFEFCSHCFSPLSESCSAVKQHFICVFHNYSVCTFRHFFKLWSDNLKTSLVFWGYFCFSCTLAMRSWSYFLLQLPPILLKSSWNWQVDRWSTGRVSLEKR